MCGRYVRKSTRREIAAWFGVDAGDEGPYTDEWVASYNVAPQTFQPVVRLNRDTGMREIALLRWGLIPYWSKDAKIAYSTINAKAETVATAPAFRDAFKYRRCLVPADAFYEWQKLDPKHKQPFAIALANQEPYGFAGVGGGHPRQPPLDLLRPFPAEQMIAWKVDRAVGNVRNDTAQLLEAPVEEPVKDPIDAPMLPFVADPQQ